MQKIRLMLVLSAVLLSCATPSFAHVTLDSPIAPAGSSYKATFKVAHGCDGSPTRQLRMYIPAGFEGAKPMPKAGWVLTTTSISLSKPYASHGKTITQDVAEVVWTAKLPADYLSDGHYDEFSLRGKLPDTAGPLWFRVFQNCESGSNDWSQTPESGTSTKGLKSPAVLLTIVHLPAAIAPTPNSPAAGQAHH